MHHEPDVEAQAYSDTTPHNREKTVEKAIDSPPSSHFSAHNTTVEELPPPKNKLQQWVIILQKRVGLEARGIEHVPESLRERKTTTADYIQMMLIWFSANLTLNNLLGLLGPLLFEVGIVDGMLLATFGCALGALGVGYISTFGPLSRNRILVRVPRQSHRNAYAKVFHR